MSKHCENKKCSKCGDVQPNKRKNCIMCGMPLITKSTKKEKTLFAEDKKCLEF